MAVEEMEERINMDSKTLTEVNPDEKTNMDSKIHIEKIVEAK